LQASGLGRPPPAAAAAPPVQFIIQNTSSVTSEQQVVNTPCAPEPPRRPPRQFTGSWEDLEEFWADPLNRVFVLGSLGLVLYICHGQGQHKWRMAQLQRRIDGNPFLRIASQVFGSSAARSRP
ncbi:unnamed protein product, partial [Polarella glacialis]